MPIYEYRCDKCGKQFEELKKGFDQAEADCPDCGASAHRLISHTSFVLKGSGWYVTDYKKSDNGGAKGENGNAASDNGSSDNGSKSAENASADVKPVAAKKNVKDSASSAKPSA